MDVISMFYNLEYGAAPESRVETDQWLDGHGRRFGHFIGGNWVEGADYFAVNNPATGEELAQIAHGNAENVAAAVKAARAAQPGWAKMGGKGRARVLYALARLLQKHARRFAVLETLDNGKPIRESRDGDIPLAIRHFYHHAGWAQRFDAEFTEMAPYGVVGQIIPWNFPLLMLSWKLAPALAAGNTVVLKPAEYTPLTAMAFAEICRDAGVPDGVVNIVNGAGETGAALVAHGEIDKVAFTGSTEVGKHIQRALAGRDVSLTLELGGKSPFIVFEDADIDAAVEGIIDSIFFNQGEVCCAGSRLLVQEAIAPRLYEALKTRMTRLRLGDPLDKSVDVGAIVDPKQQARIHDLVSAGLKSGGEVFTCPAPLPETGCYTAPMLITGVDPAHPLFAQEIFGPVLVAMTFRTESEAVALANNTRYGLAASLWSEDIDQVMAVAPQIRAGVVWINAANQFDASAEFGGMRESGFGREGAKTGMLAYLKPARSSEKPQPITLRSAPEKPVDTTRKFFIGGKQVRPDSGHSQDLRDKKHRLIETVGIGNRKDVRNAVEAAASHTAWGRAHGHARAQVLYYMAENLSERRADFQNILGAVLTDKAAIAEVDTAIDALFDAAAMADKFDGKVHSVPMRALVMAVNEPAGVIGVVDHDSSPFASPVRATASIMAAGATQVIVAPQSFPSAVLELSSLCESSDVPAGAVNIIAGSAEALGRDMAKHAAVDCLWQLGDRDPEAEALAASSVKRVWHGMPLAHDTEYLMRQASEVKSIWLPYGALPGGGGKY